MTRKYRTRIVVLGCCIALSCSIFFGLALAEDAAPAAPAAAPAAPVDPRAETRNQMGEMLSKVLAATAKVKNYTVIFTKEEFVGGKMMPMETSLMKHQRSPHCVYMKWIEDPAKGRETIYCPPLYGDKIKAHEGKGFSSIFGTVTLDPKGSMAMKGNRHSILEAGIFHTVDLIKKDFDHGAKNPGDDVRFEAISEQNIHGQTSLCMTAIQPAEKAKGYYASKAIICVHKQTYLPTKIQIWDHTGRLVETYTYRDYKINPGLEQDTDFNIKNKEYQF